MMSLYTATITLVFVMDPLGNIPMFLSILNTVDANKRRKIILRETFFAFIVLTAFLFFGQYILHGIQISKAAISIAGGIILFLIALRMIFPHDDGNYTKQVGEPFFVPLAVPLIAGPSTMAIVMLLAEKDPEHIWLWMLALFLAWVISTLILFFADYLRKILGDRGLTALERLMGMILTTMAVQLFLTGVQQFFHLT